MVSSVRQVTQSLYTPSLFHDTLLLHVPELRVRETLETQNPSREIISRGAGCSGRFVIFTVVWRGLITH